MKPFHRIVLTIIISSATLLGLLTPAQAREDVVIRSSRAPMLYDVELEPHLVFGTAPPGEGAGSGVGFGARASIVVAPDGFIRNVNDSVAIGFGLDFGRYYRDWSGGYDQCVRWETGPNGTTICTEVTSNSYTYLYIPVVMQWNFWFTRRFSAFGEPGVDMYYLGHHGFSLVPALYVGGRVQLTDRITLTGRIGYPTVAIGVSFMM